MPALIHRRLFPAVAAAAALTTGIGCASGATAGSGSPTSPAATSSSSTPTATGSATQRAQVVTPAVTKVVIFVVENHSLAEMKTGMPYVYSLAAKYAYATNYSAIGHPSLPDYLAIAGGSTFGVTDDAGPSAHRIHGASVFDQAIARGRTAKTYADAATVNCQLYSSGRYAVKHNPWTYFVDHRASCRRFDVPVAALAADARAGRLPHVSMVIPDLIHDAHDGTLPTSDAWIKARIKTLQAGPDWTSGRLAIVITADEDDYSQHNKVLTVVASKYQVHRVVTTALNHYSLTRLIDDVLGAPYLRRAATARSMKVAFGIKTRPRP